MPEHPTHSCSDTEKTADAALGTHTHTSFYHISLTYYFSRFSQKQKKKREKKNDDNDEEQRKTLINKFYKSK
jgi:hypothetical protein